MRGFCALSALFALGFAYTPLSDDSLHAIPEAGQVFDIHDGALLAPILIPRVPGTDGSRKVLQHFIDFFHDNLPDWKIDLQNTTSTTPLSSEGVPFVNFIATRDPPWTIPGEVGRLALVAHYDSLIKPEGFLGAIDSAAPCAMLLQAAQTLDAALTKKWSAMQAAGHEPGLEPEKGVQILLLDGEEAFVSWTDTDSLYGARALAEEWEQTFHAASSTYKNFLSSIDLFVLLDLLGDKNPTIPSYYLTSHWAYRAMAALEERLRGVKRFKSARDHPSKAAKAAHKQVRQERPWFYEKDKTQFYPAMIGDDHVPFMARGVEVLHLIPSPFPPQWHKITDDGEHLDMDTVEDWTLIVTAFAAEWMDLDGYLGDGKQRRAGPALAPRASGGSKDEL